LYCHPRESGDPAFPGGVRNPFLTLLLIRQERIPAGALEITPTFAERQNFMRIEKNNCWRKAVTDPVLFCREFLELEPHPGQAEWLTHSNKSQNLLVTGNRWGKSTAQAAKILHRAIFRPRDCRFENVSRYRLLNISITQDQANIIFHNCLSLIKGKSLIELLVDKVVFTPYPKLELGNGSEITARTSQNRGEYILGNDYDYINFDEVAFELHPDYVVNEVLTMRLADRKGMLDLVSTPRGRNWFYRKYLELSSNRTGAYVQSGRSTDNPFLSQEYLAAKIVSLSPPRVQQNIYGMFVDSGNEILKEEHIQQALAASTGFSGKIQHYRYIHGWDLARKKTHTVGVTLDVTSRPYQVVKLERFQNRDWPDVLETIRQRQREYGGDTVIDSTGLGDVVLGELKDIKAMGFIFSPKSKSELLTNLQAQFESGNVGMPLVEIATASGDYWCLTEELRELNWTENTTADAAMALWQAKLIVHSTVSPGFRLSEI
jgi:phage terminase large subunit-like protein